MKFRTEVDVPHPGFSIEPCEHMLFVGSCFADRMGERLKEDKFRVTANPFGVMYNPASILHTIIRATDATPRVAVMTLGTNHVYILNKTGEIVDNCQKRPQRLFTERELSVDECAEYLLKAVDELRRRRSDVKVIVTVSPIRYAKYGYHGSQLSKATLQLAADRLCHEREGVYYFPAYEILNDELRDYRFYAADMLHPSDQAVEYISERFADVCFSDEAKRFVKAWQPIKAAFRHRPFNPESAEYKAFINNAKQQAVKLREKYDGLELEWIR